MKEYKRKTERYIDEQGKNCVRKLAWDGEILHTLAELEDKIENGTLIELPFIQKGQYGNRWYVYYRKNHGNKNITWKMYYSKAEAEKKLEELSKNP